jgi:L-arabinose isomerase
MPPKQNHWHRIILGDSLLTARGIPVAVEYEVKNAQAMKIMETFDVAGSFTEYAAMDFTDDVVLMGHRRTGRLALRRQRFVSLRTLSCDQEAS